MAKQQDYFPEGKLGKKKDEVYQLIKHADEGGLDRKSVLLAMDQYAEIYHMHKCFEAFEQTPIKFIDGNGKVKYISSPFQRRMNILKVRVKFQWLLFRYWLQRIFKFSHNG